MKVYLSGGISGVPNYQERFRKVADAYRALGVEVLNPAEYPPGKTYAEYMEMAMRDIQQADVVEMLPGWQYSTGARFECVVAQKDKKQINFPEDEE